MIKIEGIKYNEDNLDLSKLNRIRFNVNDKEYIDIMIGNCGKDGIYINGSSVLSILPLVSNAIRVNIID